jgi:selenocysteine-specific elongation factor
LPDIKATELERGDVACSSGLFKTTHCLDVKLTLLASAPQALKHWQQVHLHIGTSETMARVALLKDTMLLPNNEAFGQLVLKEPVVALMGQRFVIRAYAPLRTIGGGEVLFPYDKKPRGRKARTELLAFLDKLAQAKDPAKRFAEIVERLGFVSFNEAVVLGQLTTEQLKFTLNKAEDLGIIFLESGDQPLLMSLTCYEGLTKSLHDLLHRFHEKNPHLAGMKSSDLISALEVSLTKKQFQELLRLFVNRGLIESDGEIIRLPGASPVLDEDMLKDKDKLLSYCENKGFQFPSLDEAIKELNWDKNKMNRILDVAKQREEIRIIGGEFLLSKSIEEKALDILRTLPEITIAAMRDATGASRKYILPLLEDFDARGITRRVGDKRVLLKKTQ